MDGKRINRVALAGAVFCAALFAWVAPLVAEDLRSGGATATDIGASADDLERGAKLWSQKCGQCHHNHTPDDFSSAQWERIIEHMRTKAQLTTEEERQILAFVKSTKPTSSPASR